jgi:adenine phosphoribosyltransferase
MDRDLAAALRAAFRWTDPGPDSPQLVSDRSGWWRDPGLLTRLGPALAALHPRPTVVVAPEVTGFLLGPLVAATLGVGFVEAYRPRPVPEPMTWGTAGGDHRGATVTLGVRDRHLSPADRVLVVDDWAETGAQLRALYRAIVALGAVPLGAAVVVDQSPPEVTAELNIRSLLTDL